MMRCVHTCQSEGFPQTGYFFLRVLGEGLGSGGRVVGAPSPPPSASSPQLGAQAGIQVDVLTKVLWVQKYAKKSGREKKSRGMRHGYVYRISTRFLLVVKMAGETIFAYFVARMHKNTFQDTPKRI